MAVILTQRDTPGRGCTCCPDYPARNKQRMRRHARRVGKRQWMKEAAEHDAR